MKNQKGSDGRNTSVVIAVFEDGRRGHKPRNVGGLQMLEKARKHNIP